MADVDKKAFRSLSSGLYIVTSAAGQTKAGCVINTMVQMTSSPAQVSIAINKENFTTGVIKQAGAFDVAVLTESAPMELIGRFGFHTSADFDKFSDTTCVTDALGLPYVAEHVAAHFAVRVTQTVDMGSHLWFLGTVEQAEVLSSEDPMTYAFYHQVKGGKTPPKASSYEGDAPAAASATASKTAEGAATAGGTDAAAGGADAAVGGADAAAADGTGASGDGANDAATAGVKYGWRCKVCGYVYEGAELPDDFTCPICGVGKDMFERIEL